MGVFSSRKQTNQEIFTPRSKPNHLFRDNYPTNLVIEGGGAKVISIGGCLRALEEVGVLSGITQYVGSSAGALVIVLLAAGYSADELTQMLTNTDFRKFKDYDVGIFRNSSRMVKKYGFCKGETVRAFVKEKLQQKTGKGNITLAEFESFCRRKVYITTLCLEDRKTYYLSADTHPDLEVVTAVRMSMSVPFVYVPVVYQEKHYVDGGVTDNYPITFFDRGGVIHQQTLGLKMMGRNDITDHQIYPSIPKINSLLQFSKEVLNNMSFQIERQHAVPENWARTIRVNSNLSMLDFDVDEAAKKKVLRDTYVETRTQIYNKYNL